MPPTLVVAALSPGAAFGIGFAGMAMIICVLVMSVVLCGCGEKKEEKPSAPTNEKLPECPAEEPNGESQPTPPPPAEQPAEKSTKLAEKSQAGPTETSVMLKQAQDLELMSKVGKETSFVGKKAEPSKQPSLRLMSESMVKTGGSMIKAESKTAAGPMTTKSVSMVGESTKGSGKFVAAVAAKQTSMMSVTKAPSVVSVASQTAK